MLRSTLTAATVAATMLATSTSAQSFSGTYVAASRDGQAVTLTLTQNAQGRVTGSLVGLAAQFAIEGQVNGGDLVGVAKSGGGNVYLEAQLEGSGIHLILADIGPDGTPLYQQAREVVFQRQGAAAAAPPAAAAGNPLAGGAPRGNPLAGGTDPYAGTFADAQVSLTLGKSADGYSGTLRVAGGGLPVAAKVTGDHLTGSFVSGGTTYLFEARVSGAVMTLLSDGRTYALQRQGQPGGMAAAGPGGAPPASSAPGGGMAGSSPQDQQIARLLLSSKWCHFSFSGTSDNTGSGSQYTETVLFSPDGTVRVLTGSESYYSGSAGSVAGQGGGGQMYRWRVESGVLHLSADGAQWQPLPLQIAQNSNGYPIVTAGGKEYSQCR
jgi:hypothetical protein